MKIKKAIIATSHRDSHGEILHPNGLKLMVEEINKNYLRVGVEHDPRIPPIGRIVRAELIIMEDGEYAVQADIEIFEVGDKYSLDKNSKEMVIHKNEKDKLFIIYDRSFRDPNKLKIVNEIADEFKTKPIEEVKKAADPLSILIIAGGFILSSIAAGFFGKLGSDIYDSLIKKLKLLYKKGNANTDHERLLIFEFTVYSDASFINVSVIITNPDEKVIELFLREGIFKLDEFLLHYYNIDMGLSEIYFEYNVNELKVIYGIRKDVVPIYPQK